VTRKRAGAPAAARWAQCAAKLAAAVPPARLHPAAQAWAEASSRRQTWAVAFSGGADSLCLLLLLWAHWPERRARLRALHFNHRLRGAASRGDEWFCRAVCAALGVRLVVGQWPGVHRGASEAEAREARHAFFARHAPSALWFGHQQDDIAETMLMRLARGSGVAGLAAPRPVHAMPGGRVHLRPLLTLKQAEVRAGLREAGATWREDASNAGRDFFRNRVRRDVLPAWRKAAERDALAGAARSRELLEEDDAALAAWLAELQPLAANGSLRLRQLAGKPRALVRRALHLWLRAQPGPIRISRQAFDTLLRDATSGRQTRQSMGDDRFALIRDGRLFLGPAREKARRLRRRAN
jgi:tRNA(Ile)-lysidine synthase